MSITKNEVMELLLKACPSFQQAWNKQVSQSYEEGEEGLLYLDLGELACHLVELYRQGKTTEFDDVFEIVERLHVDGDEYVRQAATIGLLEGVQNVAGNDDIDPEVFTSYLGTESLSWWNKLNDFWSGRTRFVGEE